MKMYPSNLWATSDFRYIMIESVKAFVSAEQVQCVFRQQIRRKMYMKLKKLNAALGLLSIAAMLLHIGYTVFAYLTFYYDPMLTILTAVPFMVLVCMHAICGMLSVFLQADGTRADMYPKQNMRTILQRVSAALIFPLLILHINTFGLLKSTVESGHWAAFFLLMISQPLFYGVVLTHVAVSVSRGFITLGWLTSPKVQNKIDRAVYLICGAAFIIATFVVLRTEVAMFLTAGEQV